MKKSVTFVVVDVVVVVVVFNVPPSAKVMETGSRLKVSSDRLVKLGIEPATPGAYPLLHSSFCVTFVICTDAY